MSLWTMGRVDKKSPFHRNRLVQMECNEPRVTRFCSSSGTGTSCSNCSCISPASLWVRVTPKIRPWSGSFCNRYAMRLMRTRVLPLRGPPMMRVMAFNGWITAFTCEGLSSSSNLNGAPCPISPSKVCGEGPNSARDDEVHLLDNT